MIQDIRPHKLDNQYHADISPCMDDTIMIFDGQKILCCTEEEELRLPRLADFGCDAQGSSGKAPVTYLFAIDRRRFFLAEEDAFEIPERFVFQEVWRQRRDIKASQEDMFAVATALHLSHWYRNNRFCGRCGNRTEHAEHERALRCPECGNMIYPRLVPAVIIAVTNGDEILVTKYGDRDLPFYALVAGFVEIGETLEECVEREVMEEVGLHVKNIRYYKSQPWGIVDDLLAGFYCEVDGDPTVHLDHQELKEGIWAKRGEVPLQPDHYSLTGEMMRMFNEGRES